MIVFIRSNPIVSDPRVEKETRSLITHGFSVTVLAWDREAGYKSFESLGNRTIRRFRLRTPYGKSIVLFYYPFFWIWIFSRLLEIKPTVVHACDLDSIFPALFYRLLMQKTKVIFDVYDTYTLLIQAKNNVLAKLVRPLELLAASWSDAFITVSNERLDFFSGVKLRLTEIIMNCPPDKGSPDFAQRKRNTKVFRVVYTGAIASHRGLVEFAEAIKDIEDVQFIVAGRVIDRKVADRLNNYPYVKYVGQLRFNEALTLERSADTIPLLYDLRIPIHQVAMPNKLFEAMMLGVPVITNLRDVLPEVRCGIQVDYQDLAGIKRAIIDLKEHPELRHELGLSGRLVFEQKYDWSLMEKRLLRLYHKLLKS